MANQNPPTVIISPPITEPQPTLTANPPIETEAEIETDEADDEVDALEEALHVEAIVCEERHEQLLTVLETQGQRTEAALSQLRENQQQQTDSPALAQIQVQQTEMLAQLTALSESLRSNLSPPLKKNSSESTPRTPLPLESSPPIPPESVPSGVPENIPSPVKQRRVRVV